MHFLSTKPAQINFCSHSQHSAHETFSSTAYSTFGTGKEINRRGREGRRGTYLLVYRRIPDADIDFRSANQPKSIFAHVLSTQPPKHFSEPDIVACKLYFPWTHS